MAIQHRDITGSNVHEPKGIATAPNGVAYISNGAGSGSWAPIPSAGLKGLGPIAPATNLVITSDGLGGFKAGSIPNYGTITTTNPSFVTISGSWIAAGGSVVAGQAAGITIAGTGARVTTPGVYRVSFNGIAAQTAGNGNIPFIRFRKNGSTLLTQQGQWSFAFSSEGSHFNGSGNLTEYVTMNANDYIEAVFFSNSIALYTYVNTIDLSLLR